MVEMEERELVLRGLRDYLEELRDTGVDELVFAAGAGPGSVADPSGVPGSVLVSGSQRVSGVAGSGPGPVSGSVSASDSAPASGAVAASRIAADTDMADRDGDCRGIGNTRARLVFVMNGDGFAGEGGELLVNIIKAMGYAAAEVYLLSFTASAFGSGGVSGATLAARIAAVGPEVVVSLGDMAAQLLLQSPQPVTKLRGKFRDLSGTPLMPTLHPETLLENPALKREVWSDMQQVMRRLAGGPS